MLRSFGRSFTALIGSTGHTLSYLLCVGGGGGGEEGGEGGGGLETNVFSQRPVLSLLGDSNEPTREENRLTMDDRAARLKARRFHVEEWDRA